MRGGLTLAGLAGLAVGHVVQHVLHGAAVGKVALPHLAVRLLSPLALVGMEQEHQLLLDQLAFLRVGRRRRSGHCRRGRRRHLLGTLPHKTALDVGHQPWSPTHSGAWGASHACLCLLGGLGTVGLEEKGVGYRYRVRTWLS